MNGNVMRYYEHVPFMKTIGHDFAVMVEHSRSLLHGQTPYYEGYAFPPLTSALFIPFVKLPHSIAYRIMLFLTLGAFTGMLFLAARLNKSTDKSIPVFLLTTGLFSYGFQLELERGQFNIVALFLCFLAIYLFHNTKFRKLSYLLFIISVQLKIYPILLIFTFTESFRDVRRSLIRYSLIALANFILLFCLGPSIFMDFIKSVYHLVGKPYLWVGNHSLKAFSLSRPFGFIPDIPLTFLVLLMLVGCFCFCFIRRKSPLDKYLLTLSGLCLLILPSSSHDYKLSLLPGIMCLYLIGHSNEKMTFSDIAIIFAVSILFSLSLFSYKYYAYWKWKPYSPYIFQNKFILLFGMYILVFAHSALDFFTKNKDLPISNNST